MTAWRTNVPNGEERVVEPLVSHDVLLPEIDSAIPGINDHRIAINFIVLQVLLLELNEFNIVKKTRISLSRMRCLRFS